jgi:hypothetical protein
MCVAFPAMRNPENHIQGINRIPGLFEGRSAIVRTMDDNPGKNSQVFLTDLGFTGNNGYAFVTGSDSDDNLKKTRLAINNGIQHPGGLSVVGQYVAVGNQAENENEGSTVDIYDFSEDNVEKLLGNNGTCDNDGRYTSIDAYTRLRLNSILPQNPLPAAKVSAAAIGRLASGRYVLAVEGKSSEETREFWIYISKHRKLRDPGWINDNWIFNNYFQINSRKAGENINILTDISGKTYLAILGNDLECTPENLAQLNSPLDVFCDGDLLDEALELLCVIGICIVPPQIPDVSSFLGASSYPACLPSEVQDCLNIESGNAGGHNYIEVRDLRLTSDGKLYLDNTELFSADDWEDDGHCNFRAGGGIYVDPSGMPLVYCAGRGAVLNTDYNFNIGEHSYEYSN